MQILCKLYKIKDMEDGEVLRILEEKGLPVTRQRLAILKKIQEMGCHFTARDLHIALDESAKAVDLATVYRTLKAFEEAGLVTCVAEMGNCRYYSGTQAGVIPHAHFCCKGCGRLFCLPPLEVTASREIRSLEKMGFEVHQLVVTIEGLCAQCRRREEGK